MKKCSRLRGKTEMHTGFWWGNLKERDHLEDLSIDARVTLKQFYRNGIEGHKLDYLPQNRKEQQAVVNTGMSL